MQKRILIDAVYPKEVRVVVENQEKILEYETESDIKKPIKGNIYLAKITRVEASLQAAFVDYGADRHGFLPFSDIHPDYFQLPIEDKQKLMAALADEAQVQKDQLAQQEAKEEEEYLAKQGTDKVSAEEGDTADEASTEEVDVIDSDEEEVAPQPTRGRRKTAHDHYAIQEVIKRGQVVLVQALKEERGNKGASLTTYISLAGRYCVLMPNSAHQGGISRRIQRYEDRKRLKKIIQSLPLADGTSVIVRTAGVKREEADIKRDYDYLAKLWDLIRKHTMESTAPSFIHAEGNLIKRTIRDVFDDSIEEVLIEGDAAYRSAKDFMKLLMPKQAVKVKHYRSKVPLFTRYGIEDQLIQLYEPEVRLESGGSLVMHPTEALVSVDVNSGKATGERNVEETALKTNVEAAKALAIQLRMRDLSGLIVIDFIDMYESKNRRTVERALRDALRSDRARIQLGHISPFGLLEMSRQRLRANLVEVNAVPCSHCQGLGSVRSPEAASIMVLRAITWEANRNRNMHILEVFASADAVMHLLNHCKKELMEIEKNYRVKLNLSIDEKMDVGKCRVEGRRHKKDEKTSLRAMTDSASIPFEEEESVEEDTTEDSSKRRKWRDEGEEGEKGAGQRPKGQQQRRRSRSRKPQGDRRHQADRKSQGNRQHQANRRHQDGEVSKGEATAKKDSLVKGFIKRLVQ